VLPHGIAGGRLLSGGRLRSGGQLLVAAGGRSPNVPGRARAQPKANRLVGLRG